MGRVGIERDVGDDAEFAARPSSARAPRAARGPPGSRPRGRPRSSIAGPAPGTARSPGCRARRAAAPPRRAGRSTSALDARHRGDRPRAGRLPSMTNSGWIRSSAAECRLAREPARKRVAPHAPQAGTRKLSCGSATHQAPGAALPAVDWPVDGPEITRDYGRSLYMNRGDGETDRRRRFGTLVREPAAGPAAVRLVAGAGPAACGGRGAGVDVAGVEVVRCADGRGARRRPGCSRSCAASSRAASRRSASSSPTSTRWSPPSPPCSPRPRTSASRQMRKRDLPPRGGIPRAARDAGPARLLDAGDRAT